MNVKALDSVVDIENRLRAGR